MTVLDGALLGAIQGLTEFLPVSSSGHLILARSLLGIQYADGLAFDAVLQLGTTVAALVYFRQTLTALCRNALRFLISLGKNVDKNQHALLKSLLIGTLPALVLGVLLEHTMETVFRNPLWVAVGLLFGSGLFLLAERRATQAQTLPPDASTGFRIGLFQALALLPGVSRSGSTISGGLLAGLDRESATRFSFLLSLPIITGSGLKQLLSLFGHASFNATPLLPLATGTLVSALVGWWCIHFLLRYLKTHTLQAFVIYRIALAIVIVLIFGIRGR